MKKVIIIRYGHRAVRDYRMTTHIALIGRALGADEMILTNEDKKIKETIYEVNERWGGNFSIKFEENWKKIISNIKNKGALLIHLTMYGLELADSIIDKIKDFDNDVYIFLGSQKVPSEIYNLADYNIAISHQPQSEAGALAIFLDRIFQGKTLYKKFEGAKFRIIPTAHGKNVKKRYSL